MSANESHPTDRWRPAIAPHARVVFDTVRRSHALLDPERVLFLSPSAREILVSCDGSRTTDEIIRALTERYPGAPIARDVPRTLASLHARGALRHDLRAPLRHPAQQEPSPAPPVTDSLGPPLALTAELTFRCPLRCGYCSNPMELARFPESLSGTAWAAVIDEAADAGVLQCSLSGGEPLLHPELDALIARARARGMYCNLITSAYQLAPARVVALARAGLEHAQISLQHHDPARADAIAGARDAHAHKLAAARAFVNAGVALSINAVLHRDSIDEVDAIIRLAEALGATRLELASVQAHGWALHNRDALLPSRAQCARADEVVREARARIGGGMRIVHVVPDYYADRPKPCMDGWGRKFITVSPDGRLLPCPGSHELPIAFDRVLQGRSIATLWRESEALAAFRGTGWMREPCASCDERRRDFGGCRCQAWALTGSLDATDPACVKAPDHALVARARETSEREPPKVRLRTLTRRSP
jgi:pyrroloquinoline quinone biosynthesis protein E